MFKNRKEGASAQKLICWYQANRIIGILLRRQQIHNLNAT